MGYRVCCLYILFFLFFAMCGASVVYNLRIAETTRREKSRVAEIDIVRLPYNFVVTLSDQLRKFNNAEIHQNISAALGTFLYAGESFYVRGDSAVGHVISKGSGISNSVTELDDLVFTGGYNCMSHDHLQVTLSGIFGVPLHKDQTFMIPLQFGTGHVGLGIQFDSSYIYNRRHKHIIFCAARMIYFCPRQVQVKEGTIIEPQDFDFNAGLVADLFFAHQSVWGQHRFEVGYNPEIFFGASICPPIAGLNLRISRSSFYASYQSLFTGNDHRAGFLVAGTSYGFDHNKQNPISYKYLVSFWLSGGIAF